MTPPVTAKRIAVAAKYLQNADAIARACRKAGVPFFTACAFVEQESTNGANIYGHDRGGVNTVRGNLPVTDKNFLGFLVQVMNGATSNGVGPMQITYAGELRSGHRDGGYFRIMAEQGLRPWVPEENILFGLKILAGHIKSQGSLEKAAAVYNGGGSPNAQARQYGRDLVALNTKWQKRILG